MRLLLIAALAACAAPLSHAASAVFVDAGRASTCAMTTGNGIMCWGENDDGQVGDGTSGNTRPSPVSVSGATSGMVTVSVGYDHACAINQFRRVLCWGDNSNGGIDPASLAFTKPSPQAIAGLPSDMVAVHAGVGHTCAISGPGGVWCWGNIRGGTSSGAFQLPGYESGVAAVTGGFDFACLLGANSRMVRCWGRNVRQNLGADRDTGFSTTTPIDVIGLSEGASSIASGHSHTCALTLAGGVKCWGWNEYGQVGTGDHLSGNVAKQVFGLERGVRAIGASNDKSCALLDTGGVKCWGEGVGAMAGRETADSRVPIDIPGLYGNVAQIAVGQSHVCAVMTYGALKCVGANSSGQLGLGHTMSAARATAVPGFTGSAVTSYEGLWWNAPAGSEGGWGVNLTHQGDQLFGTWFTYDAAGQPLWLVMSNGEMSGANRWSGVLYATSGPPFSTAAWDPTRVAAQPVGSATFEFRDRDNGTFTVTYANTTLTKSIVRQVYAPFVPECQVGGARGSLPYYQGLWWRSAGTESGWGVNLTHQADTLFATWFTYDASGKPTWYVLSNGARTGTWVYSGTLYRTRGPAFNASPWNQDSVTPTPVGSATFSFSDDDNGTFAYTVEGVSGSKPIARQKFAAPHTVCR